MKRSDISDKVVCAAYEAMRTNKFSGYDFVDEILVMATHCPEKVAWAAMLRAFKLGLVDYGVSLRSGWLTQKGKELLAKALIPQDSC